MVPGAPGQIGEQIQMMKDEVEFNKRHRKALKDADSSYREKKRKQKQYKMTKKDWMELLDFWPMTIVVPIMLILILFGPWIMS